jgi:hypothetical protein
MPPDERGKMAASASSVSCVSNPTIDSMLLLRASLLLPSSFLLHTSAWLHATDPDACKKQTPPCVPNKPHFPQGLLPSPPLHRLCWAAKHNRRPVSGPSEQKAPPVWVIDLISCTGVQHCILCSRDYLETAGRISLFSSTFGLSLFDRLLQFLGLGTAGRSPSQSTDGLVASSSVPDRISNLSRAAVWTRCFLRFFDPNEQTTLRKARGESLCVLCGLWRCCNRVMQPAIVRFSGCRIPGRLFKMAAFPAS